MSNPNLSFLFKIDSIQARPGAPPQAFINGHYKPPVQPDHYEQVDSTEWYQWTVNGVSRVTEPSLPYPVTYSTSVFYDSINTKRFLFHPADCRTVDISAIEQGDAGERWGWQGLLYTEKSLAHSVLEHDGEHDSLCGRGGTYVPHLLPHCYEHQENDTVCGLSGKLSLLLALTGFSCAPNYLMDAIRHRLNIRERRWANVGQAWGDGRKVYSSPVIVRIDHCNRMPWPRHGCTHQGK